MSEFGETVVHVLLFWGWGDLALYFPSSLNVGCIFVRTPGASRDPALRFLEGASKCLKLKLCPGCKFVCDVCPVNSCLTVTLRLKGVGSEGLDSLTEK